MSFDLCYLLALLWMFVVLCLPPMKSGFGSGHGDCSSNDSYKDYIDGYKHHLNGYRYKDDCECDAGYVLGDESVFGDGGHYDDYDCRDEVRGNAVYDNGVYKNEGYDNEKSSKPYRKGTRRNVICTNGAHSKVYT